MLDYYCADEGWKNAVTAGPWRVRESVLIGESGRKLIHQTTTTALSQHISITGIVGFSFASSHTRGGLGDREKPPITHNVRRTLSGKTHAITLEHLSRALHYWQTAKSDSSLSVITRAIVKIIVIIIFTAEYATCFLFSLPSGGILTMSSSRLYFFFIIPGR